MDQSHYAPQGEKGYGVGAPAEQYQYQQQYQQPQQSVQGTGYPQAQPARNGSPTMCGMKRSIFIVVLAAILFFLALVIGLGAGLGVSQRNLRQAQSDLAAAKSSISASPSPTVTGIPSGASAAPSATPTVATTNCPRSNNTEYTASSDSDKKFRRYCGIDYSDKGAKDLGNATTKTMEECMDVCADRDGCQGAGWGVMDGDKPDAHFCWLKTNLTKSHEATADWGFAVLENKDTDS